MKKFMKTLSIACFLFIIQFTINNSEVDGIKKIIATEEVSAATKKKAVVKKTYHANKKVKTEFTTTFGKSGKKDVIKKVWYSQQGIVEKIETQKHNKKGELKSTKDGKASKTSTLHYSNGQIKAKKVEAYNQKGKLVAKAWDTKSYLKNAPKPATKTCTKSTYSCT